MCNDKLMHELGLCTADRDIGSTRDFLDRSEISDERTVRGVQKQFRDFTGSRITSAKARKLIRANAALRGERIKREHWGRHYRVVWRYAKGPKKGRIKTLSRWP
jgi:hypothetical protein